jgi:hypothetical protein
MQNLLTALIEFATFSFALIMVFDFIAGLPNLLSATALADEELAAVPQLEMIAPQIEPALQQKTRYPATLQWIEQNMPAVKVWASEMPDALALCKARLPQEKPVVALASRQQLIDIGIRRCKKLASQLKIRRYNTMRLAELADVLEGKVALAELVA